MNTFRGIMLGTVVGIILWLILGMAIWIVMEFCRELPPAFSHPPITLQEKKMIKDSIRYHGDWPITREGERGIYYMHHKNGKVRL